MVKVFPLNEDWAETAVLWLMQTTANEAAAAILVTGRISSESYFPVVAMSVASSG